MGKSIEVLIVEDNAGDAELIFRELQSFGYDVTFERVETAEQMSAALGKKDWDMVLSDYRLPRFSALAALSLLQRSGRDIPFMIVSGTIGEDLAVSAMKAGANDYVMKKDLKRLPAAIERELREAQLRKGQKQAQETLTYLASYNPLTSLPNRNAYGDHLQKAIAEGKREKHAVAAMIIDLDRFREVNETLGYLNSNFLLQQVGARLQEGLRGNIVAHLGEDKFALILTSAALSDASLMARNVQQALEEPFLVEDIPIQVEASIGIAFYPDHGESAEALLQKADVAMYLAKETQSGSFIYTPESDYHNARRLALLGELRSAIEANQLVLHYQPKIDLKTMRTIGVEALVRWQHPKHGLLGPDQFVASAERTNLIYPLTSWVLETAIRQSVLWRKAGIEISVAVNFSVQNLRNTQIVKEVERHFTTYGGSPSSLTVEMTESAVMTDPIRAKEVLIHLRKIGVGISIDDFGTGYTALSYLKKMPMDEIKVDKSFVIGMMEREEDYVIVSTLIELGHNLGLTVVAEGVESEEMLKRLADFHCDIAQGHYFTKPLPTDELTLWLKDHPVFP